MTPRAVPLTVLVDDREKSPYGFSGMVTDDTLALDWAGESSTLAGRVAFEVTTVRRRLPAGDYALADRSAVVERKTLADLYATLSSRERRTLFQLELAEMTDRFGRACVVVEEDWRTAMTPPGAGLSAYTIRDMVERLRDDFPGVLWASPKPGSEGRRGGEWATLLFLFAHSVQPAGARARTDDWQPNTLT